MKRASHLHPGFWMMVLAVTAWGAVVGSAAAEPGKYLGPSNVVATPDGKTLLVLCQDAGRVALVDPASGKVLETFEVPVTPTGLTLSPDGKTLYVTSASPLGSVSVVDVASRKITATIPAGHTATAPAISPDGKRLYVCNRFDNDVSVIDLAAGKEIARVKATREPIAAAVTPDGKTVFVANLLPLDRADGYDVAATVTVIDAATNEPASIRLPNGSTSLRGHLRFARRQVRLRHAHPRPVPDADHATGAGVDEHERAFRSSTRRRRSSSTRCCWTTSISARPTRGAWPRRPTAGRSASPTPARAN